MPAEAELYTAAKVIPTYAVIGGVGIALTLVRLWARTYYIRVKLAADDAAAVGATIFVSAAIAQEIANGVLGTGGNGVDTADTERRARTALKINWINPILEPWGFGLIKLSLSLFYRRIFGVWPSFRKINNAIIVLLVGYILAFSFGQLFLCGAKFYYIWIDLDQHRAREHCAERGRFQFSFALVSVITDILVLGLPSVFIGRLQMATRKKWTTACVFLLGFISTGASIARLIYVSTALRYDWFAFDYQPKPGVADPPSYLFTILNPTLLATIEMGLGLWGANLPALAPLLNSFHPVSAASSVYRKLASSLSSTTRSARRPSAWSETEGRALRKGSSTRVEALPPIPNHVVTSEKTSDATRAASTPSLNSW